MSKNDINALVDRRVYDMFTRLTEWHAHQTDQLKTIVENRDAAIALDDVKVEADSDMAKGIRFGVGLALNMLGKLPVSMSKAEEIIDE